MTQEELNCNLRVYGLKLAELANKLANYSFIGHPCLKEYENKLYEFQNWFNILSITSASDTCITDVQLELLLDKLNKLTLNSC